MPSMLSVDANSLFNDPDITWFDESDLLSPVFQFPPTVPLPPPNPIPTTTSHQPTNFDFASIPCFVGSTPLMSFANMELSNFEPLTMPAQMPIHELEPPIHSFQLPKPLSHSPPVPLSLQTVLDKSLELLPHLGSSPTTRNFPMPFPRDRFASSGMMVDNSVCFQQFKGHRVRQHSASIISTEKKVVHVRNTSSVRDMMLINTKGLPLSSSTSPSSESEFDQSAFIEPSARISPSSDSSSHLSQIQMVLTDTTYPCKKCGKAFSKRLSLRSHQAVHSGSAFTNLAVKQNVCFFCKKSFVRRHDMLRHERNVHAALKELKCKTCDQIYESILALQAHCEAELHEPSEVVGSIPKRAVNGVTPIAITTRKLHDTDLPTYPISPLAMDFKFNGLDYEIHRADLTDL